MKKLVIAFAVLIMLAGGTVSLLKYMSLGPFQVTPEELAAIEAENAKKEKTKAIKVTAQQLTIEANEKLVHTKTKIKLIQANNYIQAVGMKADMNINKIEFLSKTRSHYASPTK